MFFENTIEKQVASVEKLTVTDSLIELLTVGGLGLGDDIAPKMLQNEGKGTNVQNMDSVWCR